MTDMPPPPATTDLPRARMWTAQQVAAYLGLTPTSFADRLPALEDAGLPAPLFGQRSGRRWDAAAIERWLNQLSGLEHRAATDLATTDDALAEQLRAAARRVANAGD